MTVQNLEMDGFFRVFDIYGDFSLSFGIQTKRNNLTRENTAGKGWLEFSTIDKINL